MKATIICALIVAALIAFTILDTKRNEKAETAAAQKLQMLRLPIEQVSRIEIRPRGQAALVIEKGSDSKWYLKAPITELADQQEVANFIRALANERSSETVSEGTDINFATYGLNDPSFEVLISDGGSVKERIRIGSVKAYDDNVYARIDDESRVELATVTWDSLLTKRLAEYRDKKLYRSGEKPVTKIEISQGTPGYPKRMVLNRVGEDWKMVEGDSSFPLSNDRVNDYLEKVRDLRAQDFHAEDKSEALDKFGLKKPALTLRLYGDATPAFFELSLSAPDKRGDVYATSSDLKAIVSIYKLNAEPIARRQDDFFAKKRPFTFDATLATEIEIHSPDGTAVFKKTGTDWSKDGIKLEDSTLVTKLVEKLASSETLRVFEAATSLPKGAKSVIVIRDAKNETLLNFEFGPPRVEKAEGARPEARYILGLTNKSNRLLGLPPRAIENLNLSTVLRVGTPQRAEK